MKFWNEMFTEINHWDFIGSKNLQFPQNYKISLRATALLWQDFKNEGKEFLPVGVFNQDCLENFNSQLRNDGGHRKNPCVRDFPATFATSSINLITVRVKGKNCRDENSLNLVHLEQLFEAAKRMEEKRKAASQMQQSEPDMPVEPVQDNNVLEESDTEDEECLQVEDEEGNEDDDKDPTVVTAELDKQLKDKMQSIAGANVAAPIVKAHVNALKCEDCTAILHTEPAFPLHLIRTLSASASTPAERSKKLPSESISKIAKKKL